MIMNIKKILLLPPFITLGNSVKPYIPMGILSLKAMSDNLGEEVDLFKMDKNLFEKRFEHSNQLVEEIVNSIDLKKYDTIGLSTWGNTIHISLKIAREIKRINPHIQIWMGGPHVSPLGKKVLEAFDFIDAVFVGEGELTFREVLERRKKNKKTLKGIPGIYTREYEYQKQHPIKNLDLLPMIDFSNYLNIFQNYTESYGLPIEVSRGCSGRCTFCSTRQFWGKVRYKTDSRIISEMRTINKITGVNKFEFIGDNFSDSRQRILKFCHSIKREAPEFKWECDVKLNNLNEDDLDILWQSGCRGIFVGMESASQKTLNLIKKDVCLARRVELIKVALMIGFEIVTSFIIGFPWETTEDIKKTFELQCKMLELGAARSQIYLLCPLPGTELIQKYKVNIDNWTSYIASDGIPMDEDTRQFIHKYSEMFPQFGYFMNENLSRIELIATQEAASQLNNLYNGNVSAF